MRWTTEIKCSNDPVESYSWVLVSFISVDLPACVLCCLSVLEFLHIMRDVMVHSGACLKLWALPGFSLWRHCVCHTWD